MKLKKIIISTLAAACAVTSVMGFASCDMLSGLMGEGEHTHELSLVKGLEATCTKAGVKDYYTCSGCDGLFSDAEGLNEITSPERIPAGGHQEEIVPAKPATCLEDGVTEGKKCGKCGKVLVHGEVLVHEWLTVDGTHYCADTLEEFNVANASLTYENGEFNLVGNGATLSALTAENAVLNVSGTLTVTGEAETEVVTANNSRINFVGGTVTVNGHVRTEESWVKVDNNAVLNVNGTLIVNGECVADETAEYKYDHRFFIRQGTINAIDDVSREGEEEYGVVCAYSIQIGSEKDNVKGYLNIQNTSAITTSGNTAGRALATRAGVSSVWDFANGEINCVGNKETGNNTAIALVRSATRYVNINPGMTIKVTNFRNAIGTWSKNKHIGMHANALVLVNTDTMFWREYSNPQKVYAQVDVQMQWLDEATGETRLANVRLEKEGVNIPSKTMITTWAEFTDLVFPTVEDYDKATFLSWVEA